MQPSGRMDDRPHGAHEPVTNLPFLKMHGAANDFVVFDHREAFLPEPPAALVRRLCDRRRGIGADGVLLLERDREFDFAMRYFNADGDPADFCGNGARCLARLALDLGLGRAGEVRFRTAAGVMAARREERGGIALHFGAVERPGEPLEVEAGGRRFTGSLIRAGVPHFVTAVAHLETVPIAEWGAALRRHPTFGAEGANVDFVTRLGSARVAMRTYERGVEGETLACGSGAIATALWAADGGDPSPVAVRTAGGDELRVVFRAGAQGWDVTLCGPAEVAFAGTWSEPVVAGRS
jgi:diaminopimelate epimerase